MLQQQQLQDEEKCVDVGPRWSDSTSTSVTSEPSIPTNMVSGSSKKESKSYKKEEQESDQSVERQQYTERVEVKQQKINCKQPLPGFHQAFGSTEIGRFSRSEFFANMVGESNNVSNDQNCVDDEDVNLTSTLRLSTIDDLRDDSVSEVNSNCLNQTNSCGNSVNNFGNLTLASYYNEARNPAAVAPRWHSPCVSAIGSEI